MVRFTSSQVGTLVINKGDLLENLKAADVAKALNISKSAVSQWGDVIPELSAEKLLRLMPELPHKYIQKVS